MDDIQQKKLKFKQLNMKSLNKKSQTLSKIYGIKSLEKRNLAVAFLKVKLFMETLREGEK